MPPTLVRRLLPWAAVLIGLLLHVPALRTGFYADDHMHQLALEGRLPLEPWGLYDFGGYAEWAHVAEGVGGFPWWTSPEWSIRFFRPLSSLTLWLDHVVHGRNAVGYHLTSVALLGGLLLAAHALYRRLGLGPRAAAAAVLLLAASEATVLPTGWIANRNSLLAALFTVAAVAVVVRREGVPGPRALVGALALGVCAAASKESGGIAFLLVALWLGCERRRFPGGRGARLAAAFAAAAVVHVVALAAAGYGTRSVFYATPWSDPGRFLGNLATVAGLAPLSLLTPVPTDLAPLVEGALPVLLAVSLLVGAPVALWMRRRLRAEPAAGFLALWVVVAVVPQAGTIVSDRLYLDAAVGAAGLIALLLARTLHRRGAERVACGALILVAGALQALMTVVVALGIADMAGEVRQRAVSADVGPPSLGRREVLVLQAENALVPFSIPSTWAFWTGDLDVRFSILQTGRRGLRWTREDARTIRFESLDEPFVTGPFETVYRVDRRPFPAGTRIETPAFDVEVVEPAPGGGVRTVRLRWPRSVEDPRFRFLVPRDGRLVDVDPPPVGETRELPTVPRPSPLTP